MDVNHIEQEKCRNMNENRKSIKAFSSVLISDNVGWVLHGL